MISALFLGGIQAPATAADGTLTVTGTGTSYTTITIPRDVTLAMDSVSARFSGRYAGVYLEEVGHLAQIARGDDGYDSGVVLARDFRQPGDAPLPMELTLHHTLKRGTYRVYLIAEGTATVTVRAKGLATRTVSPRTRTASAFQLGSLKPHLNRVESREPLVAGRRAIAFSTILVGDLDPVYAGSIGACVVKSEGQCGRNFDAEYGALIVNPQLDWAFWFAVVYQPGMLNGRLDAIQAASNATGFDYAIGMGFALTLV